METPEKEPPVHSRGIETLVGELPKLTIRSKEYEMRGLNIQDSLSLLRIFKEAATWGVRDIRARAPVMFSKLSTLDESGDDKIKKVLEMGMYIFAPLFGITEVADELLTWFGDIIGGVSLEDMKDTKIMPMGSELVILNSLLTHPDFESFLSTVNLLRNNPQMMLLVNLMSASQPGNDSKEASMDSNADMDGSTTTK